VSESFDDVLSRGLEVAQRLAREAGAIQRAGVRSERTIQFKGDVDLVTDIDIESERIISEGLREAFPDFMLTGEEGSTGSEFSSWRWVIDPLDGTTNFAHGYPQWAVSIALDYDDEVVAGVIYDPMRDEMFSAAKGRGATLNGETIRVSGISELRRALVATGVSYDVNDRAEAFALWEVLNDYCQGARRDGAAALDMAWVAAGRLDAYAERPINNWDIGAGVVIVREAGGLVTAMDGSPHILDSREVCASNGMLHEEIVSLIADKVEW